MLIGLLRKCGTAEKKKLFGRFNIGPTIRSFEVSRQFEGNDLTLRVVGREPLDNNIVVVNVKGLDESVKVGPGQKLTERQRVHCYNAIDFAYIDINSSSGAGNVR
jgi:hypothetical protein